MSTAQHASTADAGVGPSRFHAVAWRWHFYTGLYVVPFLLMLALTGAVMVFYTGFQTRFGFTVHVTPQAAVQPVSAQAQAVLALRSQGQLLEYIAPRASDEASWFVVKRDGLTEAVAVDPHTAQVLHLVDKENTVFAWAERIHGTLLMGDVGDRLIEVAAGFGIVMIATGLYLWWPRGGTRWAQVLVPNLRQRGRLWWRSLHACAGFWLSAVLFVFLLTGLSWTGVWGAQFAQPWGTFPATKWEAVPQSGATHTSLNTAGQHEVPWGLEWTPLPASGSAAGPSVNLDSVAALAKQLGFTGQHHIQLPKGDTGVFTISADTMSGDLKDPTKDRTVHVDQHTGRVIAEVAFADYPLLAQGMAVGIALHQGDLGWWNAVLNLLFCAAIVLLCVSGVVMWWKRRPARRWRIGAPPVPRDLPLWKGGAVVMCGVALAFPLSGAVLLAVLLLDGLVLSRLPALRQALG
ncbi:PepSY-associated TM helix domain-containing protein [Hydrogenophaga sp. PBL-H3]|uniref:PepSY-associated TM helix domain-containing protein n=1 Tax=Hydrogenophaga sp. PBL-H3 TaxID=434010 RepID=UPI00131FA289|nr:PepSY domain-containing protein [Hydrogenophaga sp. PBL-H3]QHE75276.1 PepSY domain-containing protein [Hydrogenophaga sp. PBL-H3]QHE79703.1 PepSY domain-containing protein [Hydrogenophaga sp. PBL-H3]